MAQGADADRLMHVSLPLGNGSVLMGSDRLSSMGEGKTGDNFSISVNTASQEEATELFNNLSAGGTVTMPLDKTFWGAFFGMFTDKFGIAWMVNYDVNEQP
jgi:PhnB protein